MKVENLVGYEDSESEEEEEEFMRKDAVGIHEEDIKIHEVLPLRQMAPDKNEDCSSSIIWEDFSSDAAQASSSKTSWNSIKWDFVDMGYSSTMVEKALSIHGTENWNEILEYLLACK
ncbi:hypothetical protein KI387_027766, partial [Taxus chinensis]